MTTKINTIESGNLWYLPTGSLHVFLKKVGQLNLPKTLAILGCADGNYVIPAAKKGFEILAIDIDSLALYGGQTRIGNIKVEVTGLKKKLKRLGLQKKVKIINQSYLKYQTKNTYSGVIVSENMHYEANSKYTLSQIINKIQGYMSTGGLLFLEHLHFSKKNNDPNKYLTSVQLASYFKSPIWKITSNKKKTYEEAPNLRINRNHKVIIGRLYAQKMR